MTLGTPYLSILGAVCTIFWMISYLRVGRKAQIYLSSQKNPNYYFSFLRGFLLIIGLASWISISYSLTTPRKPMGLSNNNIEVNDILFVVDVSRSMLAEDFVPNRLEAAKIKILEFVKLRPKDRIGIIMFSEKAFTLLPLSTDLKLIEEIVKEIKVGFLGSGTNIGDAVGLAVARAAQSIAKNKVLILLTDGVSNVGTMTPLEAAREAKKQNIKIYTIGIGGSKDARIPLGRSLFGRKQYQTIPGGSIDVEVLKEIANITKGKYFIAADTKALKDVLGEIERLERTEIEASSRIIYKEMYFIYLLCGVVGLFLVELSRRLVLRESV
ncbi:MAG: VWA domain-containing protein [Bacteriovoracaceae bacterium]|jgi:Ca-activated chloride channel homolog|nr:VWA domain-containing protein [Bacteriovoracaceae bacterium]